MPWSSLVSVLTSGVVFSCYKHVENVTPNELPVLPGYWLSPPPPIPYLYASCPSHLVSKCKLGQCSNPGQPIYYGWRITWWLQVTEENSRAEHYALPALSDLCSSVTVLTHCDGTVYSLYFLFFLHSVVRFTPIMFASSLGNSRAW